MRIIVLSQWYPPEPESKIHLLARDLVARGHEVTSITGYPNYPTGKLYPGFRIRWRQWEERDGVRVLRLPLYPSHDRSGFRRALNYGSFAACASLLGPLSVGPADVMWVYHPPLTIGMPAWVISLTRGVPFVYEVQDMWPETLAATGMLSSAGAVNALAAFARFVYRRAAAITVISPGFKRNLVGKGVPAQKIHVIPNWADEDVFRPVPPDPALAAEYGLADKFNIVFAGNMGAAQALDSVLDAAGELQELASVQFVFMGDGVDVEQLKSSVQQRSLTNVRFIGRQPVTRMPHLFAHAAALLVHLRRDPLFEITIPSKTIAYMACGRPVISATEGDAAAVVAQAGAGLVCPPEDPAALVHAVRTLLAMSPESRAAMGEAGRQAYLRHYTRHILVSRYEALLQAVAATRRVQAGQK